METRQRVDFAKQRARLDQALERMRSNPDRAVRGGPSASVRVLHDRECEARTGEHTFTIDEPIARGGSGKGPSAMDYFVAGAAGCLTSQLTQYAALLDVPFTDLEVEAEMAWDNRQKWGIADLGCLTMGFVFRVSLASDAPHDRVIELLQRAEEGCYASDAMRNAIPMRAELTVNGEPIYSQGVNGEVPDFPSR